MTAFDPLARIKKQFKGAAYPRYLALTLRSAKPGHVTIRMANRKEFRQYRGKTHGGAIAGLLDTAATMATNSLIGEKQDSVTIELKVNYLKAGMGRYLEAHAEVLHHGRTTSISKVEVRRADGELCAYATVTNLVYPSKD